MAISEDVRAKVLRYHHVEKWRVGTISHQLGIHHTTVKRILAETGVESVKLAHGGSMIDPYLGFIHEQLKQYPTLTAKRLYDMVCERGYQGGPDHFRHLISLHRPKRRAEAYLRLKTLPGEQSQTDWGLFGTMMVGNAKRQLSAFVMVLSYSRKIFLRFYLNQRMSNFLNGHERAFSAFGGVPKVVLYDNLKSAVLARQGDAIHFHPTLLAIAAHYRFEPRPVAVARGNEKGRVERAIRYIRSNFFSGRQWRDLEDLNTQAEQWCSGLASRRPCPDDRAYTVAQKFVEEKPHLIALPNTPYSTAEQITVKVGKTPYVRFDLNDYSVPYEYVHRTLEVRATEAQVTILATGQVIASHRRSYDKLAQIEEPAHIDGLVATKSHAKRHRYQDRLIQSCPSAHELLKQACMRHYPLKSITAELMELLSAYGAKEVEIALQEALRRDVPHPNAVRLHLEKRREENNKPPAIPVRLPNDKRVQNQVISTHSLQSYDSLHTTLED